MKIKLEVIEVPANGKPNWNKGAYTIAFVYSKHKGNFILKGYLGEVQEYLKKNYTHYFCNMTLWSYRGHRNFWEFWKDGVHISSPDKKGHEYRTNWNSKFMIYNPCTSGTEMIFKRMPKRWIPEFDNF